MISLRDEQFNGVIQKIIDGSFSPAEDYLLFMTQALITVANTGSAEFANTILKVIIRYPDPIPVYENFQNFFNSLTVRLKDMPLRLNLTLKPIIAFSMANGRFYDAVRFIGLYEKNQQKPDKDIARYKRSCELEIQELKKKKEPDLYQYTPQDLENIKKLKEVNREFTKLNQLLRERIIFSDSDFIP